MQPVSFFLRRGFNGTSTRDIAKVANITQPALYSHFADKEVIFIAVISEVGEMIREKKLARSTRPVPRCQPALTLKPSPTF